MPIYPRDAFVTANQKSPLSAAVLHIIDTVFFASLMPEEGAPVPMAVAIKPRQRDYENFFDAFEDERRAAWHFLEFNPIPLTATHLKKLAHGLEYGKDVVVIRVDEGQFSPERCHIVGIARRAHGEVSTDVSLVVAAPRPGVIVLEGADEQLFQRYDAGYASLSDVDVLGVDTGLVFEYLNALGMNHERRDLVLLLRRARAARCGALFACVRDFEGSRRVTFADDNSIAAVEKHSQEMLHAWLYNHVVGKGDELANQLWLSRHNQLRERRSAFVEMLGALSSNDGAIVLGAGLRVLGVNVRLVASRQNLMPPRPDPQSCRDIGGRDAVPDVNPRGTRHNSAYDFAWENEGSVLFCVSADGPISAVLRDKDRLLTWPVRIREV